MNDKIKALRAAFPCTLPVLTGFTFLGIAYGILMNSKGFGVGYTILISLIVFAGSAQYVAITFLTTAFNPIYALVMTIMVNARHLFYGISMLEKYRNLGRLKPYLIFGLCDETFSIVCSVEPPQGIHPKWFRFFVTLLDHFYWVLGSALGGILGSMITFNTKGLDFVLTALFVVIFVDQWKTKKNRRPASIGVLCSVVSLVLFGKDNFIIPAMLVIIAILSFDRKANTVDQKHGKEAA